MGWDSVKKAYINREDSVIASVTLEPVLFGEFDDHANSIYFHITWARTQERFVTGGWSVVCIPFCFIALDFSVKLSEKNSI